MSGATARKAAIDELDADEQALMKAMQAEEPEPPSPEPPRQRPVPEPPPPTQEPPSRPEPVEPGTEAEPHERGDVSVALRQERELRRRIEQRLQEVERRAVAEQATVQERLRLLSEAAEAHIRAQQPAPPPPEPAPDFATDPAGFLQHGFRTLHGELSRLNERIGQVETGSQRLTQAQQEQQAAFELQQWGLAGEKAFAETHQDYPQAIAHLQRAREAMVRSMGFTQPQQIQAAIQNDVRNLAEIARRQNMNFGEMLYNLAAAHGYQAQGPQNGGGSMSGGLPSPQMQQNPAETAAERLVRGAQMSQTVGATAAAPRGEVPADRIASMNDAEFEQIYSKLVKQGPGALKVLFGE